jgi:hypothetical protein
VATPPPISISMAIIISNHILGLVLCFSPYKLFFVLMSTFFLLVGQLGRETQDRSAVIGQERKTWIGQRGTGSFDRTVLRGKSWP